MEGQVEQMVLQNRLKGKGKCNCRLFELSAHPFSGTACQYAGFLSPASVTFRTFQADVLQVESSLLCMLRCHYSHPLMLEV